MFYKIIIISGYDDCLVHLIRLHIILRHIHYSFNIYIFCEQCPVLISCGSMYLFE